MQKATKKCFLSILAACALLVGPAAIYRAGDNLCKAFYEVWGGASGLNLRTNHAIWERDRRCETASETQKQGPVPSQGSAPGSQGTGETFLTAQYNTAASEIRERLGNENVLFALKFTLLGGIMAVLFSLMGKKYSTAGDFEGFMQKGRVSMFFVAALLCSAIIDTRLRFNGKVIESLGDWVWCIERYETAQNATKGLPALWEHFLHVQLRTGSYPIMRYFCHFLTAVLYAATVYLFIVTPSSMSRRNKMMLLQGGRVFFALLFFVSVSYDRLHFYPRSVSNYETYVEYVKAIGLGSTALPTLFFSSLLTILGARWLRQALEHRFVESNAFVQTGELKEAEKAALREDRVQFACFYAPEGFVDEVEKKWNSKNTQEAAADNEAVGKEASDEARMLFAIIDRSTLRPLTYGHLGWQVGNEVRDPGLRGLVDSIRKWYRDGKDGQAERRKTTELNRKARRRKVLRVLPQIAANVPDWSKHNADKAEDRLWDAYFGKAGGEKSPP